jgi:hypothetical protein
MTQLKIGYQPLSATMKAAGDRRRLLFWAKIRGHDIVTDLSQKVDVLVASENADFQSRYFHQTSVPIVFDLVDAYLSPLNPWEDLARGMAKKLSGQISGNVKPFSHHVRDFCSTSSAVICSSPEQEAVIKPHNSNTHVILDSHDEIPLIDPKLTKGKPTSKKIVLWEGQPATIRGVKQISTILFQLSSEHALHFNFITDEKYFQLLGRYFKNNTLELLKKDLGPLINQIDLIPWTPDNLVASAKMSSVSMIPIDLAIPMQKLKPENRLLIMWRLGLPCLTSPSPAYIRVANQAGVKAICDSPKSWLDNFSNLIGDPKFALEEVLRGQNYLYEYHRQEALLKKWDRVMESVMG